MGAATLPSARFVPSIEPHGSLAEKGLPVVGLWHPAISTPFSRLGCSEGSGRFSGGCIEKESRTRAMLHYSDRQPLARPFPSRQLRTRTTRRAGATPHQLQPAWCLVYGFKCKQLGSHVGVGRKVEGQGILFFYVAPPVCPLMAYSPPERPGRRFRHHTAGISPALTADRCGMIRDTIMPCLIGLPIQLTG
jgi:hypothetical protein